MTLRYLFGLLVTVVLGACPNPNTYTSPRTMRAGDVQLLAAAEGYAMIDHDDIDDETQTDVLPSAPTVGVRYAMFDSAEVGLRAVNLSSLALDTKVQLHRGEIDVALDPGVQWFSAEIEYDGKSYSSNVFHAYVPVLIGWNLGRRATLVMSPGVALQVEVFEEVEKRWLAMGGIGINLRATRRLALQPQVTAAWDVLDGKTGFVTAGIGFSFGGQPDFDGVGAPATESAALARR
jgi:hypothetical protein